jgi:hypothetical protein
VYLPSHVALGEAVVVDGVGPGRVGGDFENGAVGSVALRDETAVELAEGREVLVESTVSGWRVFGDAERTGGGWLWSTSSGIFDASKHANFVLLEVAETIETAVGLVGDDQRVVELWRVRVVSAANLEGVSQTTAKEEIWSEVTVDVPCETVRDVLCDSLVAFLATRWSQSCCKRSNRLVDDRVLLPHFDFRLRFAFGETEALVDWFGGVEVNENVFLGIEVVKSWFFSFLVGVEFAEGPDNVERAIEMEFLVKWISCNRKRWQSVS